MRRKRRTQWDSNQTWHPAYGRNDQEMDNDERMEKYVLVCDIKDGGRHGKKRSNDPTLIIHKGEEKKGKITKYGKPEFSESMCIHIVINTLNLAYINFFIPCITCMMQYIIAHHTLYPQA